MSKLPPEVAKVLDRFDLALTAIENKVTPMVDKPMKETLPKLDSIETAKLNLAYSYTLNSLYYMYLKVNGVSPQTHPVRKELDRVKNYMAKTLALEKHLKDTGEKDAEAAERETSRKRPNQTHVQEEEEEEEKKREEGQGEEYKDSPSPKARKLSKTSTPGKKADYDKPSSRKKNKKKKSRK